MEIQLPRPISRIVFRGCSEQTKAEILAGLPIHEQAMLTEELLQRARATAKEYHERLAILIRQSIRQEAFLRSTPEVRKTFLPPAIDDGVTVIICDPASPPERIRIEGSTGGSDPGSVKLAIVIGKDGAVTEVDPLAGPEAMVPSAVDAVRRRHYRPTLVNGRPVEVETTVDFS